MRWVRALPTGDVLLRARVGCGWRRAGRMAFWAGQLGAEWWCIWLERRGPGQWRGFAYRLEEAP